MGNPILVKVEGVYAREAEATLRVGDLVMVTDFHRIEEGPARGVVFLTLMKPVRE